MIRVYFRPEFIEFFGLNTIPSNSNANVSKVSPSSNGFRQGPVANVDEQSNEPTTPVNEKN